MSSNVPNKRSIDSLYQRFYFRLEIGHVRFYLVLIILSICILLHFFDELTSTFFIHITIIGCAKTSDLKKYI